MLADSIDPRVDFELFKSAVGHRLRPLGDVDFIIDTLERQDIRTYHERAWYPESLYLLAMVDYLSRINDVPLCSEYDDLRCCKLSSIIYPRSILAISAAAGNDKAMKEAERTAIPEFLRFNIVENDVRNVV